MTADKVDVASGTVASGPVDVASMRISYADTGLSESELAPDWVSQFRSWLADAVQAGIAEPNAMVVATADADGSPASRTVLMKDVDADGITFYTNYGSAKSADLSINPRACATFPWIALQRQVHVRGTVHRVDDLTTAAYWATRPRGSQLGAWASPQSTVIGSFPAGQPQDLRPDLESRQHAVEQRFGGLDSSTPIPVPPQWGGWRIVPQSVEFWQGRRNRLHDRLRFNHTAGGWVVERLAP